MSVEAELAKKRCILKIRSGSHLYGTNTPSSDEDFLGIFIPPTEYLIGLRRMEEVDDSVKDKDPSGKNTVDAVDCKYYTLEKFARLAIENNPNIIEILFVNEENIVEITDVGKELLSLKNAFISKNLKHRFLGYAFSQKHKMVIKLANYEALMEAAQYLKRCEREWTLEVIELDHHPLFIRKKDHISVGDINMPVNSTVKKAKAFVENRISQFGSRQELVTKYGMDTKFASHLLRLIIEGIELLQTGDLVFPLKEAEFLKDVRNGKYSLDEILEMAETYEKEIEGLYISSKVQSRPDFSAVENFVVETHKKFICEK